MDGQIVVAPGDILLPQNIYVREPITHMIEKGFVVDIRGRLDAELVKSYMADFNDLRGMGIEPRSFQGIVMFSTRPNDTACHLDIPMRGCSALPR